MKISKVKIEAQHSDGTWMSYETTLPKDVFDDLIIKIGRWKEHYGGTVSEIEEYIEELENINWDEVKRL